MRYKHRPLAFACYAPEGAGSGTTPPEGGDSGDNANAGGGNPNPDGGRAPEEPLTFDQLLASNRDYQSEFDRKVTQALTKARQTWDREQAESMDEAKRLEKMTATERAQYQLSKDKATLEQERAAFARERLQVSVGAELQKRGLSADFAVYLTGSDAETSKANIDTFEILPERRRERQNAFQRTAQRRQSGTGLQQDERRRILRRYLRQKIRR